MNTATPDNPSATYGECFHYYRKYVAKLSQPEAAKLLNVSPRTIWAIERDEVLIPTENDVLTMEGAIRKLKKAAHPARCPNDTNGDGDCHICLKTGYCPHQGKEAGA